MSTVSSRNRLQRNHINPKRQVSRLRRRAMLVGLIIVLVVGYFSFNAFHKNKAATVATTKVSTTQTATANKTSSRQSGTTSTPKTTVSTSVCASDTETQEIIVSVSARHLWACTGTTESYNSPVVTGMENLAADLTPTGTYHIYAKATNLTLSGSDSTGSWNDPVSYWMPFLDNQYGAYGFHDATWRSPTDFGNISPNSSNASHGCVECPLATAKWLYGWAPVGTTVVINS